MKRYFFSMLSFTLFFLSSFSILARETLAILPFSGGQGEDGETIAELFMFDPSINSAFTLLPRTNIIRAIRNEQLFQLSGGMTDPDNAILLGRELGAKYVIAGNITHFGDRNLLTIGIIDTQTLEQIAGVMEYFSRIEEIIPRVPIISRNIVSAIGINTSNLPKLATTRVSISGAEDSGDILAQILSIYLIQNGQFAIYPRTRNLEQVQEEWQNQLSGNTADESIVRIGVGENPRYVLSIVARRLGEQTMFNASIIDLESGTQAVGASVNYRTLNDGIELMRTMAGELSIRAVIGSGTETEWQVNSENQLRQVLQVIQNERGDGRYTIIIARDFSISEEVAIVGFDNTQKIITIKSDNQRRTISSDVHSPSNFYREIFSVRGNITLILDGQLTLNGDLIYNSTLVSLDGGILELNEGVILQHALRDSVIVRSGRFTMNGGTICDNIRNGVHIRGVDSVFIMNGGTITRNNSGGDTTGGGVLLSDGSFTMNNGNINDNKIFGVELSNAGSGGFFIMNSGIISRNSRSGVFLMKGSFTMTGGIIRNNNEHGVSLFSDVTFIKNGGTIEATNRLGVASATDNRVRTRPAGPNDNIDSRQRGRRGGWD